MGFGAPQQDLPLRSPRHYSCCAKWQSNIITSFTLRGIFDVTISAARLTLMLIATNYKVVGEPSTVVLWPSHCNPGLGGVTPLDIVEALIDGIPRKLMGKIIV